MVYQLCSPASARTKQEAGRLLCGSSRVKVAVRGGHRGTESQGELSVLRMYESGRKAGQKSPFLSRLGSASGLCFVGVAGNSGDYALDTETLISHTKSRNPRYCPNFNLLKAIDVSISLKGHSNTKLTYAAPFAGLEANLARSAGEASGYKLIRSCSVMSLRGLKNG
jgi:hypothetical protein